jgi:hypothetical protein
MEVSGQLHAPTALSLGKELPIPTGQGWVCPSVGLVAVAKRKIPSLCRNSNPGRPARNLAIILTEPSRLAHYHRNYHTRLPFTNSGWFCFWQLDPFLLRCQHGRHIHSVPIESVQLRMYSGWLLGGRLEFDSRQRQIFDFSPPRPDRLWSSPRTISNRYRRRRQRQTDN